MLALESFNEEIFPLNELNTVFTTSAVIPSSPEAELDEKKVHFGSVQIRNYERVLGDNPACSCGSPTSLGWKYTAMDPIPLDQYEGDRNPLRGRRQLKMSPITRRNILHNILGYTHEEIDAAEEKMKVIRRQREKSKKLSSSPGKDAVRAIGRKIKRTLSKERLLNASMFMPSPMMVVRSA